MCKVSTCSVEGCEKVSRARGYCNMHYLRLTRTGTLEARKSIPLYDKLFSQLKLVGDCWEWQGYLMANGYGVIVDVRAKKLVHRAMYEIIHGPIPDGLFCCHRCDNPKCCRPEHLFLGTHRENMDDMDSKGRRRAPKGVQHPRAKVSDDDVLLMRQMYSEGVMIVDIAKRFPVVPCTVSAIVNHKTWRHLS